MSRWKGLKVSRSQGLGALDLEVSRTQSEKVYTVEVSKPTVSVFWHTIPPWSHKGNILWRCDLATVDAGCPEVHFLQDYLTWFAPVLIIIMVIMMIIINLVIILIINSSQDHIHQTQIKPDENQIVKVDSHQPWFPGRRRSEWDSGCSKAGTWAGYCDHNLVHIAVFLLIGCWDWVQAHQYKEPMVNTKII